jgi:hypothetical protein
MLEIFESRVKLDRFMGGAARIQDIGLVEADNQQEQHQGNYLQTRFL